MTQTQSNLQITEASQWRIDLSNEAVEFLCGATKNGFSRLEAYHNLLSTAAASPTLYKPMYGHAFYLAPGQFVISITDLAESWQWARETVRKFFDKMESLTLLKKEQLDRCSLITLNMAFAGNNCDVYFLPQKKYLALDEITEGMAKWLCGRIRDKQFTEIIEHCIVQNSHLSDSEKPRYIAELLYIQIRKVAAAWAIGDVELPADSAEDIKAQLFEILNHHLSGNWESWLAVLNTYNPDIYSAVLTPLSVDRNSTLSVAKKCLDSIFAQLGISFAANTI